MYGYTQGQSVKYHMSAIRQLPENIQRILEIYCSSLDSQSLSVLVQCALAMTDTTKSEATWAMPDARIASIVSHGLAMINQTMTLDIVDPSVLETDTSSDTDSDNNDDEEEFDGGLLMRSQSCAITPRIPKTLIAKWDPAQMPK
jgi:hypothetical protein